jgi:hypothetical protein
METPSTSYHEKFPVGSPVRIKSQEELEEFKRNWKLHHPLLAEQIAFGGQTDSVAHVSFYHGGDVLYELKIAPGTWHEQLLDRQG